MVRWKEMLKRREEEIEERRQFEKKIRMEEVEKRSSGADAGETRDEDRPRNKRRRRNRHHKPRSQQVCGPTGKEVSASGGEERCWGVPRFTGTSFGKDGDGEISDEEEEAEEDVHDDISDDGEVEPRTCGDQELHNDEEEDGPPEEVAIVRCPSPPSETRGEPVFKAPASSPPQSPTSKSPSTGRETAPPSTRPSRGSSLSFRHPLFRTRPGSLRRGPPTLLEKLLDSEIRKERSELLQCVKYVVEKDFFGVGRKK